MLHISQTGYSSLSVSHWWSSNKIISVTDITVNTNSSGNSLIGGHEFQLGCSQILTLGIPSLHVDLVLYKSIKSVGSANA